VDQLGALLHILEEIRAHLDLGAQAAWFVEHDAGQIVQVLASLLFQTADPAHPDRPFTQIEVIGRYEPLVQLAADAGLTGLLVAGFYKIMWVRAGGFMSQVGLRQLLPRACLAALLINFGVPLVQAAVDFNNALCAAIGVATRLTAVDFLTHDLSLELVTPGLKEAVAVLLIAAYAVLAFSYVVRFAVLVVLTVLTPAAALLLVLHDTQAWTRRWVSLFVSALLSQPLHLLILAIAAALDAYTAFPLDHVFALAGVYVCFKVPGALRSTAMVSGRAGSAARRHGRRLVKVISRI
jgi:TrbL/VirB6 plasmid conjugal transfer protein